MLLYFLYNMCYDSRKHIKSRAICFLFVYAILTIVTEEDRTLCSYVTIAAKHFLLEQQNIYGSEDNMKIKTKKKTVQQLLGLETFGKYGLIAGKAEYVVFRYYRLTLPLCLWNQYKLRSKINGSSYCFSKYTDFLHRWLRVF